MIEQTTSSSKASVAHPRHEGEMTMLEACATYSVPATPQSHQGMQELTESCSRNLGISGKVAHDGPGLPVLGGDENLESLKQGRT